MQILPRPAPVKSKLERLYHCQKHAAPVIYHKDR